MDKISYAFYNGTTWQLTERALPINPFDLISDYIETQTGSFTYDRTTGNLNSTASKILKLKKGNSLIINAVTNLNVCLLYTSTAKIIFQTGQLAGYTIELLEAGGFISSTKTFYLNRVKDEANLVVPSELLRPAVGDKYIIVDIMMPETYVLAAETLLKTKAQEYLDKNSRERFQYAVVSDPFYFEAQNVNIALGSTVHFTDAEFGLDCLLYTSRCV